MTSRKTFGRIFGFSSPFPPADNPPASSGPHTALPLSPLTPLLPASARPLPPPRPLPALIAAGPRRHRLPHSRQPWVLHRPARCWPWPRPWRCPPRSFSPRPRSPIPVPSRCCCLTARGTATRRCSTATTRARRRWS